VVVIIKKNLQSAYYGKNRVLQKKTQKTAKNENESETA